MVPLEMYMVRTVETVGMVGTVGMVETVGMVGMVGMAVREVTYIVLLSLSDPNLCNLQASAWDPFS